MHASCFWLGINHLLTLCALGGSPYTYGKTTAHRDHGRWLPGPSRCSSLQNTHTFSQHSAGETVIINSHYACLLCVTFSVCAMGCVCLCVYGTVLT